MPHLVVDISSHGFGHLAQVAPVVEALKAARPDISVTARCALPPDVVKARMPALDHLAYADMDVGMVMASAMSVLAEDSHHAHLELHRHWPHRVEAAAAELAALAPDLMLCDIPYLSIAAARTAGVTTVALCSLNWADVYRAYCGSLPGAAGVLADMEAAYAAADLFLAPAPHLPMAWLPRTRSIAPIGPPPGADAAGLRQRLGIPGQARVLLAAFGGFDTRVALERWPPIADALWMVPAAWGLEGPHIRPIPAGAPPFSTLLAAAALVLTKPGYGTFVEAAAQGVPVLYVERPDWPETPYLDAWLRRHVPAEAVPAGALGDGSVVAAAERLLKAGPRPPRRFDGATEAAAIIASLIDGE